MGWVLCWELSLLIGKDTENWLRFHGGTAPPAFLGLLLLLSSTSICGCTAVSVWALQPWHWDVYCLPMQWALLASPCTLTAPAAGLPHCSSPSLSSGVMGHLVPGGSTLELFLHLAPR